MNRLASSLVALLLAFSVSACDDDPLAIPGFTDGTVPADGGGGVTDGSANVEGGARPDAKVDSADACVPTEEVCDGKDNDCDGVVDNVSAAKLANDAKNCGACGTTCQYLNGFGKCVSAKCELDTCAPGFYDNNKDPKDGCEYSCVKSNGGVETCPSSQPNCACDGVDNDCDGQIDEDFDKQTDINNCGQCGTRCLYNNASATCDQGTCKMNKCTDGFADLNQDTKDGCEYKCPVWPPTAETCDGIDNDCDGNIDEGLPGAGVACDSGLLGECKAGTTRCENGKIQCVANKTSQPETCDGKDNDCDGNVDNGFNLQSNTQNCGQCGRVCTFANASASCVAGQCTLASCTPGFRDLNNNPADGCEHTCQVFPPSVEKCNGKDDDCDNQVDEGFDLQTDINNCGTCGKRCSFVNAQASCRAGQCVMGACDTNYIDLNNNPADGCEYFCVPTNNGTEICDNVDNNCDGRVDEGFNLQTDPNNCGSCGRRCAFSNAGATCVNGQCQMAQCTAGYRDLNNNPTDGCEYRCPVFPTTTETCNGQDDNCDGRIDEGLPGAGVSCNTGQQGECSGGTTRCQNGRLECVANLSPQPETCDGKDNDCDGNIDNGFNLQSNPQHCGQCGRVCSFANATPLCIGGQCQIGTCNPGYRDLNNNPADGCEHTCAVFPTSTERCNGRDDDCDNQIDEDFNLQTDINNCGQCGRVCGFANAQASCVNGQCVMGQCNATYYDRNNNPADGCEYFCVQTNGGSEICDNVDNNCDGQVDETFNLQTDVNNCGTCGNVCSFSNAGATCVNGQCQLGPCTPGFRNLDGIAANGCEYQCPVNPPAATDNNCDGVDNNCDGRIDEGYSSTACGSSTGQCQQGQTACINGNEQCQNAVGPSTEVCDNLDNDCDGNIDNGFNKQSDPRNCGTNCVQCSLPNAVANCTNGVCGIAVCQAGWVDLDGQPGNGCEYQCTPTGQEICDGIDNDCDGLVDGADSDMAPLAGNPCATAGACSGATASCQGAAGWVCNYSAGVQLKPCTTDADCTTTACDTTRGVCPNEPIGEETRCDNIDNDCDGLADEPFSNKGQTCYETGQQGICQGSGVYVCNAAGTATECNVTNPGQTATNEVCNGKDDDCDGQVDENTDDGGFLGVRDDVVRIQRTYNSVSYDFYIYRYEASRPDASAGSTGGNTSRACSKSAVMPWANVTQAQAAAACAAAGKRLCTRMEWFLACSGAPATDPTCNTTPNDGCYYPYGDAYSPSSCNGAARANPDVALATGALSTCQASGGIYDLSGNLREWTNDPANKTCTDDAECTGTCVNGFCSPAEIVGYTVRGGAYDTPALGLRCDNTFVVMPPTFSFPNLGFRCCADAP